MKASTFCILALFISPPLKITSCHGTKLWSFFFQNWLLRFRSNFEGPWRYSTLSHNYRCHKTKLQLFKISCNDFDGIVKVSIIWPWSEDYGPKYTHLQNLFEIFTTYFEKKIIIFYFTLVATSFLVGGVTPGTTAIHTPPPLKFNRNRSTLLSCTTKQMKKQTSFQTRYK